MNIEQVVATPDGLRAVYLVSVRDASGQLIENIVDRTVDAVGLLTLEPRDARSGNASRQRVTVRETKLVGIVFEGMLEPKPAPLATSWFERIYGENFVEATFLGYTRSAETIDEIMAAVSADEKSGAEFPEGSETPEMRATRRYWIRAVKFARSKKSGQ